MLERDHEESFSLLHRVGIALPWEVEKLHPDSVGSDQG
jgi:hypothetical protein